VIRARRFNAALVGSDGVPFAALAKWEGVSPSYFTRLVRLSYLAPGITQAILDGRQPRDRAGRHIGRYVMVVSDRAFLAPQQAAMGHASRRGSGVRDPAGLTLPGACLALVVRIGLGGPSRE